MFTYRNSEFKGELSIVQGAGNTGLYHLMIDQYYKGRLRVSAFDDSLVFDGEFADLAEGFGDFLHLLKWIKSELSK